MATIKTENLRWSALMLALALGACGDDGGGGKKDDTCTPGAIDCSCIDNTRCNDGATCSAGVCTAVQALGWSVSDVNARACEVLMTESTTTVASVSFDKGAKGKVVREAPLVGISFIAGSDAPLEADFMKTNLIGGAAAPAITKLRCFDKNGALLANAQLSIE